MLDCRHYAHTLQIAESVKEKLTVFAAVAPSVLLLDFITKRWALAALDGGNRLELLGGFVPLTLAFNRGAAFGISVGDDSRWFFIPITILALVLLFVLLRQAERQDWLRLVSITMVVSGALGNLYDRVRWDRGVGLYRSDRPGGHGLADLQCGGHVDNLRCGPPGDFILGGGAAGTCRRGGSGGGRADGYRLIRPRLPNTAGQAVAGQGER